MENLKSFGGFLSVPGFTSDAEQEMPREMPKVLINDFKSPYKKCLWKAFLPPRFLLEKLTHGINFHRN